ncbi:MAG: HAD family hydrolase [Gammaproteobacteria bacterium]|jgi:2-haloalkanoic acid dehalogenase type II|nr:HAD family hydrolase [Gammaproteobacteria bacterium]
MNTRGVFFDLGGTLFSYRNVARTNIPLLVESVERLGVLTEVDAIKRSYSRASGEVSRLYAEKPFYRHRDMFHDMFVRFCELLDAEYDAEVHSWYHDAQQEAILDCLLIRPDCIETLEYLQGRGLYLSIVSNIDDDMLEPLVEREGLDRYFDHWTSSEAAQSCKPDPKFFDVTLEKSGLAAECVLFVGDSPEHDIVGANAAGMRTALIIEEGVEPPLQTGREAVAPDHTIRALSELKEIV